jgi:LysM repeat protein
MYMYNTYSSGSHHTRNQPKFKNARSRSGSIRFKTVRFLPLIIIAVIAFAGGAMVDTYSNQAAVNEQVNSVSVTVMPGDTLWSIAKNYAPEGTDIRNYIYKVKKLNGLAGSSLSVGQTIVLP